MPSKPDEEICEPDYKCCVGTICVESETTYYYKIQLGLTQYSLTQYRYTRNELIALQNMIQSALSST